MRTITIKSRNVFVLMTYEYIPTPPKADIRIIKTITPQQSDLPCMEALFIAAYFPDTGGDSFYSKA
jgi:hypothetical protein